MNTLCTCSKNDIKLPVLLSFITMKAPVQKWNNFIFQIIEGKNDAQ